MKNRYKKQDYQPDIKSNERNFDRKTFLIINFI